MLSTSLRKQSWAIPLLALVALLRAPVAAHADDFFVDCVSAPESLPPGTYPTINTAIRMLPPGGFHTITVLAGPCIEPDGTSIGFGDTPNNGENITLQAPEGQSVVIPAVFISRARGIVLRRLVIGPSGLPGRIAGIRVSAGSEVTLEDITIENQPRAGLSVDASIVQVLGSFVSQQNGAQGVLLSNSTISFSGPVTIQNNGGRGVFTTSSVVAMGRDDGSAPVRISGNMRGGIGPSENSAVTIGGDTIIENNGATSGSGIDLLASRLNMGAALTQNIVRDNRSGINIGTNSSVTLIGNNLIQNNGQVGISVGSGSSLVLSQAVAANGAIVASTIEGHTILGINVVGSAAQINGQHKIRNNGFASPLPAVAGGIRVTRGDLALTGLAEVTANNGPGIQVDLGSQLALGFLDGGPPETVITGNAAEGIRITKLSAVQLFQSATMSGNGVSSISCDKSSWLFGNTSGITGIACTNFEADKAKK
jgi:hypothetical protein